MDVLYKTFDSTRRFGMELEVNKKLSQVHLKTLVEAAHKEKRVQVTGWGYTTDNAEWIVKTDATCGDAAGEGGFEVVSPARAGADHLLDIGRVAASLAKGGAMVNNNCGLHVHVEIKEFNDQLASTLLAYWFKIEKVVANMVPKHRTTGDGTKYCKLFAKKKDLPKYAFDCNEFWGLYRPKKLDPTGKRTALTLVNYARTNSNADQWYDFHRKTVELRLPEGTLEPEDVMNWGRFFVCFVEAVAKKQFPGDVSPADVGDVLKIMDLDFGLNRPVIFSAGLYATKRWILNRVIKFGRSHKMRTAAKDLLASITFDGIDYSPPKLKAVSPLSKPKRKLRRQRSGDLYSKPQYAYDDNYPY